MRQNEYLWSKGLKKLTTAHFAALILPILTVSIA